jgi:hypothetical protein
MPELKVLYPSGLVGYSDFSTGPTGMMLVDPLKNSSLVCDTVGRYDISGDISDTQGVLEVDFVTGPTGLARAVVYLVDAWPTPTKYIGIGLDVSNRVTAQISIDGALNSYGVFAASGRPLPERVTSKVKLVYNLRNAVHLNSTVALQIGETIYAGWYPTPTVTTATFKPTLLLAGFSPSVVGLPDFNGHFRYAQLGRSIELVDYPGVEPGTMGITFVGVSSLSLDMSVDPGS